VPLKLCQIRNFSEIGIATGLERGGGGRLPHFYMILPAAAKRC
jgi:hypothetical protein